MLLLFALLLPHGMWNNLHMHRLCMSVCLFVCYREVNKSRKEKGVCMHICIYFLQALSSCIASNLDYTIEGVKEVELMLKKKR